MDLEAPDSDPEPWSIAWTEHAHSISLNITHLKDLLSLGHSPFIDVQHHDSLGIYVPLSDTKTFRYTYAAPLMPTLTNLQE